MIFPCVKYEEVKKNQEYWATCNDRPFQLYRNREISSLAFSCYLVFTYKPNNVMYNLFKL